MSVDAQHVCTEYDETMLVFLACFLDVEKDL